jgi:hypothetical protein
MEFCRWLFLDCCDMDDSDGSPTGVADGDWLALVELDIPSVVVKQIAVIQNGYKRMIFTLIWNFHTPQRMYAKNWLYLMAISTPDRMVDRSNRAILPATPVENHHHE